MPITVNVFGGSADFGADYGTAPLGVTYYIPFNKAIWGDDTTSYYANETTPMPVQVMAVTGEALTFTGNMGASGTFPVVNNENGVTTEFLVVGGSTSGDPITVTGSVDLLGYTTGMIEVTGGRYLDFSTDSVTVTGEVGISGGLNLSASTNSVSVYGFDGSSTVNTLLFGSDGTTIGASGDALNVNLVNSGISFDFTVATGVTNANAGANVLRDSLVVMGATGMTPIIVKGRNGEAIEVTSTVGDPLEITGAFFRDGVQKTQISEIIKPSTIISGSTFAATTGSQLIVASTALKTGVTIKSDPSNTDLIYIGNSGLSAGNTANGYPLESGESFFVECSNANLIHLTGITGDRRKVNYIGS
jgi:hypothetical protein